MQKEVKGGLQKTVREKLKEVAKGGEGRTAGNVAGWSEGGT